MWCVRIILTKPAQRFRLTAEKTGKLTFGFFLTITGWSTLYKYFPKNTFKSILKVSLLNISNFDQMGGHRWLLGVLEPRSTKVFLSVPTLQVKALVLVSTVRRKNTCHWICHYQHFPCANHKEEVQYNSMFSAQVSFTQTAYLPMLEIEPSGTTSRPLAGNDVQGTLSHCQSFEIWFESLIVKYILGKNGFSFHKINNKTCHNEAFPPPSVFLDCGIWIQTYCVSTHVCEII